MVSKITFLIIALASLSFQSEAGTYFVRTNGFTSGTHSGLSWVNAFNGPQGVTYATAATNTLVYQGNQTNYVGHINVQSDNWHIVPASGTATEIAAAGWEAGFAGPVTIYSTNSNLIQCNSVNGVDIDGGLTTNFTFRLVTPNTDNNPAYLINPTAGASHIRVEYFKAYGLNTNVADSPVAGDRRLFNSSTLVSDIYIGHFEAAYFDTFFSSGNINNFTVEYGFLYENWAKPGGPHNNMDQTFGVTNCVFQFNIIARYFVEGHMMCFVSPSDAINQSWDIRGNLWIGGGSNATRAVTSQYVYNNNNIRIYNNTFVGLSTYCMGLETNINGGITYGTEWGPGCFFSNNIVIACGGNGVTNVGFHLGFDDYTLSDFPTLSGSHSIVGAGNNIFVDYAGQNFHIVTNFGALFPRGKGVDMSAFGFTHDMDGYQFGTNGAWDIGAFVANASSADITPPTVTFVTPTSSPTYATSASSIAIAGTATDNVALSSVTATNTTTGQAITLLGTGSWSGTASFQVGANVIVVTAKDTSNNTGTGTLTVTYTPVIAADTLCCLQQ